MTPDTLSSSCHHRIGVDLGGTKIEAVVLDNEGRELARRRIPTPTGGYAATLRAVTMLVDTLERDLDLRPVPIGIGTPGTLSRATGNIKNSNSTWLNGHPLDRDLAELLGRPVRIQNDANCFAISEAIDGAGAGSQIVFGVILGTGVGAGLVMGGTVIDGPNGITGEWGHNPLPWPMDEERPGPVCSCGRRGCIETFLSGPGMAALHRHAGLMPLTPAELADAAAQGDLTAVATLDRYTNRLARGLAHVINIIDPDVIVLGGGLSNLLSLYDGVPRLWGRWVFSDRVDTKLVRAVHGDSSGVRGAAWLWPSAQAPAR